jgi:8-oxo-dGTP diphosphatase
MEARLPNIRIRVAGILLKDGEILLVRHEKNQKNYWLLPGGGVEFGETAEAALIREFQEEVGLNIKVGKLVLVHDSVPPSHHRQVLNLYFAVTADKFEIQVTTDEVLKDAQFYPLAEFSKMTVNPDVKTEIMKGLSNNWAESCLYLGNRWRD